LRVGTDLFSMELPETYRLGDGADNGWYSEDHGCMVRVKTFWFSRPPRVALCLLSAGVPALADVSAPASAGDRVLSVHSLLGPFASIEAYCEQSRREDDNMADWPGGATAALAVAYDLAIEIAFAACAAMTLYRQGQASAAAKLVAFATHSYS
jgi:hypothetical protein